MPLPLGIRSETEREVFQFLCSSEIANKGVNSVEMLTLPVTPRLGPHAVVTWVTVDRQ